MDFAFGKISSFWWMTFTSTILSFAIVSGSRSTFYQSFSNNSSTWRNRFRVGSPLSYQDTWARVRRSVGAATNDIDQPCWQSLKAVLNSIDEFTGDGFDVRYGDGVLLYYVRYGDGGTQFGTVDFDTQTVVPWPESVPFTEEDMETAEILHINSGTLAWSSSAVDSPDPKALVLAPRSGRSRYPRYICQPTLIELITLGITSDEDCLTRLRKEDREDAVPYFFNIAINPLSTEGEPQLIPSCPTVEPESNCSDEFETKLSGALMKLQTLKNLFDEADAEIAELKESAALSGQWK